MNNFSVEKILHLVQTNLMLISTGFIVSAKDGARVYLQYLVAALLCYNDFEEARNDSEIGFLFE